MITKGIFSVFEKDDVARSVEVYAVRNDKNGYPQFLIYKNGQWMYKSAKHFVAEKKPNKLENE